MAILTGNRPKDFATPPLAQYFPRSMFTLLEQEYEFEVWEAVGNFCPDEVCLTKRRQSLDLRVVGMVIDLGAVYLHLITPDEFQGSLPIVTQSWSNFTQNSFGRGINQRTMRACIINA